MIMTCVQYKQNLSLIIFKQFIFSIIQDKALQYFTYAGSRGQVDGGVAIAFQMIKGTSRQPRDVYTAVEWVFAFVLRCNKI